MSDNYTPLGKIRLKIQRKQKIFISFQTFVLANAVAGTTSSGEYASKVAHTLIGKFSNGRNCFLVNKLTSPLKFSS